MGLLWWCEGPLVLFGAHRWRELLLLRRQEDFGRRDGAFECPVVTQGFLGRVLRVYLAVYTLGS